MKIFAPILVFLMLMLAGTAARAGSVVVTVGDNFYNPKEVTIHPGDTVKWHYQGGTNSHPTASDNGAWTTFTINSANVNMAISQPFTKAGSFPYHCTFHGGPGVGMYGVITVAVALPVKPAQLDPAAFSVYPNPAREVVKLMVDHSKTSARSSVQLINTLGSVVRTLEVSPAEADRELTVSVADLPTGIYVYRLLANNQVVATQRLVLLR